MKMKETGGGDLGLLAPILTPKLGSFGKWVCKFVSICESKSLYLLASCSAVF